LVADPPFFFAGEVRLEWFSWTALLQGLGFFLSLQSFFFAFGPRFFEVVFLAGSVSNDVYGVTPFFPSVFLLLSVFFAGFFCVLLPSFIYQRRIHKPSPPHI